MSASSDGKGGSYKWRFFRAGGFDQVRLDTGADLQALDRLDQKLWVALSCPVRGLEFDTRTLELIDADKDGRIRANEMLAAVKWACSMVRNPDDLLKGSPSLPLSAINDDTSDGKQLLASAKQILINLGKSEAAEITLEDTADTARIFAQTKFNGDGIVPADSAEDPAVQAVIADVIGCLGPETDRSGRPGVSLAKVDEFFAEAQAYSDWWKQSECDSAILPLGEETAIAVEAFTAVKAKIEDYFTRCRVASFDSRAVGVLNRVEAEYAAFSAKDLSAATQELAGFPMARVEAGRPLPMKEGVNPAWVGAMARFNADVVKPIVGEKSSLTEGEWTAVCGKLAAYEAWAAGKAGASVEKLGLSRVREILDGNGRESIVVLIARDKALEPEAGAIASVDKLVRLHRDLPKVLNNFVSFRDFYGRKDKAVFQAGTLYLDSRACELCVRVHDAGKHAALAGFSKCYLAYCDCTRKGGSEKMTIAAAFTGGDSDYLMVGRNGVFYDRQGQDWDATITKVIENPISVRQAFWSPYKKLVRLIEEQVARRAAAADAAASGKLSAAATGAANIDKAKPAEQKKVDVGTVAALGVAVGAIGTAFAAFAGYLAGVLKLPFWQICLAFVGALLIVSGPAMLIAWLKLRQRNLGPILDANGWAINARVKLNVPFGGSLTKVAALPAGAQSAQDDPFGERPRVWPKLALFVVAVCFIYSVLNSFGLIYRLSDGKIGTPSKRELAMKQEASQKSAAVGDTAGLTNAAIVTNAPPK